ncbi:hypothetical protein MNBD_GAMMA24-938 [hydrothermal vent metagenome]|uniref:Uncharacterized protein n=1 Tax=hydrothermal vent metagenome TaxID=652676 RepID=A0A3B1BND5_9ZZZZ
MRIRIRSILVSAVVLCLSACGGGNSAGTPAGASTGDSNNSNNANDATNLVVSGGIARFKNNTAGPDTFIGIEQADQNPDAFPVIASISSIGADRLAINDKILVTNNDGASSPDDRYLKIIDLTNFEETGRLNRVSTVLALNFAPDGILFIDTAGQGLHRVDFSNLKNPVQLKWMPTLFTDFESYIRSYKDKNTEKYKILFQATGVNGLDIWSIETAKDDEAVENTEDDEELDKPTLLSRLTFKDKNDTKDERAVPFQVRSLAIPDQSVLSEEDKKKKTLLISARAGGVFVLDVTNPAAPFIRDRYFPKDTEIWDIAVAGRYAYLAAGNQIQVLDIRNLDNIVPVIGLDIPGFVTRVRVNDGYVVFALADAGVLLHRLEDDPGTSYTLIPMPDAETAQDAVYQSKAVYVAAGNKVLKLSK